ncbi:similar to Saccharomyces cerevisiae YNL202W SPS19 Peroxisomal 2,4-dienoyl-CoA reductase, auxiliary enzyme of fatty acid beta-oxidation [Maudiozyma saulgeensis]|uniref:2,4-dienoyl-CoA reductase [(3E)-enoyl-CoA-producing] n=1 Tax=Maudiozyma saulgeensis TaxID=1789683 RepID=A0A1X7R277_9SACH|nr:similar to Saccharomyces cerevisiae YNL202W SPS19 Peroxisomal 2,4-dienoyl-CoA reductase, auxiliary enzyme of fatty acid beta-oxidation [Kazachstania saulgeensis]
MPCTLDYSFVKECSWKPDLFKDKVVFITGGSGTICRVQAEALVLLGCKAALVGRDEEKLYETSRELCDLVNDKERCLAIPKVDVREFKDLENAVNLTLKKFGRIDFVIAGAAGNFICDFMNLSPNAFKSVVNIDLLGSFNTVKAVTPALLKSKGSILFVSATFHYYGVPFQGPVGAAKAGIDALSNNLAVELAPLGIRSNCIAPGAIDDTEGFKRLSKPELVESVKKMIPLQRLGTKRDIAEATVFMFSPAANYINGHVIVVDGGMWHTGTLFTKELYPHDIIKNAERAISKL